MSRQQALAVALDGAADDGTGRVVLPAGGLLSGWVNLPGKYPSSARVDVASGAMVCSVRAVVSFSTDGDRFERIAARFAHSDDVELQSLTEARAWCDEQAIAAGWTLIEAAP